MRRGSRGFTLLEVLIAFIIAALALGVMFDAILGGTRAAADAGRVEEALSLARSRLALAGYAVANGTAPAGEQSGDEGNRFRWRIVVAPAGEVAMPRIGNETVGIVNGNQNRPRAVLYAITVTVSWPGGARPHEVRAWRPPGWSRSRRGRPAHDAAQRLHLARNPGGAGWCSASCWSGWRRA